MLSLGLGLKTKFFGPGLTVSGLGLAFSGLGRGFELCSLVNNAAELRGS